MIVLPVRVFLETLSSIIHAAVSEPSLYDPSLTASQLMLAIMAQHLVHHMKQSFPGHSGSGMFIMNWHKFAPVVLSAKSRVDSSQVIQVSILKRNHCWLAQRLTVFALAFVLVNNLWSLTSHIFIPNGNVTTSKEYNFSRA